MGKKGNVYVFDAAVVESGYVSGHIRTRDYVLKKLLNYMPWLHISFRFHPGIAEDRTRATAMCRG